MKCSEIREGQPPMPSNRLSDTNLLMVCRTMGLGGTEKVVLQLCESFSGRLASVTVASSGGENEERLARLGVAHVTIPDVADRSPAACREVASVLRRITRERNVGLIHSHHRMAALYARTLFPHVPKVVTAHNVFEDKRTLTRLAYGDQLVVACGPRVEENLVGFYDIPKERVRLVTNSVEPFAGPVVPISEIKAISDDVLRVGFLGRLSEQKGCCYIVEAMGILARRGAPVHCFIAGEGELEGELRLQVERLGLGEVVTFLGRRDDPQNFLSQVDVLAMPSLWEGLPLSLIESFSVGTPVVGTTADGIMDALEDGANGVAVPLRDAVAMADALGRLTTDRRLLSMLAEGAKRTYAERFSYLAWQTGYERVYEEAIAR